MRRMRDETHARSCRGEGILEHTLCEKEELGFNLFHGKNAVAGGHPHREDMGPLRAPASLIGSSLFLRRFQKLGIVAYGFGI